MKALNLEKVKAVKVYKCRSGTGYFEWFFYSCNKWTSDGSEMAFIRLTCAGLKLRREMGWSQETFPFFDIFFSVSALFEWIRFKCLACWHVSWVSGADVGLSITHPPSSCVCVYRQRTEGHACVSPWVCVCVFDWLTLLTSLICTIISEAVLRHEGYDGWSFTSQHRSFLV